MVSSPLVTTDWLEDHLADPDIRIIEVCSITDDKTYHEGHIPGAMWLFWKSACWQDSDRDFYSITVIIFIIEVCYPVLQDKA